MMLSRHHLCFLWAAAAGFACACSPAPGLTSGGGRGQEELSGDFLPVSPTQLVLAPGSEQELIVQYVGGAYRANNVVEFAVLALETPDEDDGDSPDAPGGDAGIIKAPPSGSLTPAVDTTDPEGRASTRLRVGSTSGRFQVRARMGAHPPIYFDIEVSESSLPQLSVHVKYDGLRVLASRSAAAIPNLKCAQVTSLDKNGAEVRTVESPIEEILFSLSPQQTYAVVAWGRDATNAELASGCQEVTLRADEPDPSLVVPIQDKEMNLVGTSFPIRLALEVEDSMARLASVTRAQTEALLPEDALHPEAEAYLAAVHDVLVGLGESDAATQVLSSGDVTSLASLLTANKAGYLATADALSDLLTSFGANLWVHGRYGVGAVGVQMTFDVDSLVARSEDGKLAFDLMNASSSMALSASILATYDKDRALVDVATLSINFGLGTYGRSLLDALGKEAADWYVSRFSGAAGCDALATWLAQDASVSDGSAPLCDAACAASACKKIIGNVVEEAHAAYPVLNAAHATISLAGKVSAHERNGDGLVDDLGPSEVTGNWGKALDEDAADAVGGVFSSAPTEENSLLL